jgi:hypothetical protein
MGAICNLEHSVNRCSTIWTVFPLWRISVIAAKSHRQNFFSPTVNEVTRKDHSSIRIPTCPIETLNESE